MAQAVTKIIKDPRLIIWAAVLAFALDRTLKAVALREAPACAGPVAFSLYFNRGLSFSLAVPSVVLWVLLGLAGAALVWAAVRHVRRQRTLPVALLVVALGAASNFYDRLVVGAVVDYLLFFCWSAINIADVMIVGGLAWTLYKERR